MKTYTLGCRMRFGLCAWSCNRRAMMFHHETAEAKETPSTIEAEVTRLCCPDRKGAEEIQGRGAAAWERFVFFSPFLTLSSAQNEVSFLTSAATFLTACQLSVTIQFKQWSLTQTPPPVLRSSLATEGGRTHRMRNIRSEQQLTKR